jgi:hypothetical protein
MLAAIAKRRSFAAFPNGAVDRRLVPSGFEGQWSELRAFSQEIDFCTGFFAKSGTPSAHCSNEKQFFELLTDLRDHHFSAFDPAAWLATLVEE